MSTPELPTYEVLESIEGMPTCITLRPYKLAAPHVMHVHSDGNENFVTFDGLLAHIDGLWCHHELTPSVFHRVEARVVPRVEYVAWAPNPPRDPNEFRVAIDFDNVLNSYTSKWEASDIIPDPPRRRSEGKVLRRLKHDPDAADEALLIEQNPEAEDHWRYD
jgi:hypothetical protein